MGDNSNDLDRSRHGQLPLETALPFVSAIPLGWVRDRIRRTATGEREKLVASLRGLIEEMGKANTAAVAYEDTLVPLRNIERYRESATAKFLHDLDLGDEQLKINARDFVTKSEAEGLKFLLQKVEAEIALVEAQERLNRLRNPAPQKPAEPKRDAREEKIRNTMGGGGRYSKMADEMEAELTAKRGGKDSLTDIDKDRIKNARRQAAEYDEGHS